MDPYKLIEQGISIFPTDPGDKRPVARDPKRHPVNPNWETPTPRLAWSKAATTDPAQIDKWVSDYKGCRWGTPTGDINGFIAVDIDLDEADEWWSGHWFEEGSDVQTPSGGRHIRYEVEPGDDFQTNKGKVHPGLDIRAEGGYVVAYTDDYSNFPAIPENVAALLPRRTHIEAREDDAREAADSEYVAPARAVEVSEAEKRVLKGITDTLDALPRPWKKGAGYHDVQFRAACHLHRIINSPHYATTEESAKAIFDQHAPLRNRQSIPLREERWESARHHATGQIAEHPGDTPIRLDVTPELLDKYADSEVDRLFWESKRIGDVKKLIRALRLKGATEQESYSISYECAAMKKIHSGGGTTSTWGFVTAEYDQPTPAGPDEAVEEEEWIAPKPKKKAASVPVPLITEEERALIRRYPNFIDSYIDSARAFYANPNYPLHYVNAWVALSVAIGDKGSIFERKGRAPLSLWGLNLAPSASGKSDATAHMRSSVNAMRPGGWASVNLGRDASAEQLLDIVIDRPGKSMGIFMDECREFLDGAKRPGSYESKVLGAYLGLYDGEAERQLRRGMDKEQVGETAEVSFTLWMQGAWDPVIETMDERHIRNGFVGRFLVAVGGEAIVTRESLTPDLASEHQVENSGRDPMIDSFCVPVRQMVARLDSDRNNITFASQAVLERYVDMREQLEKFAAKHALSEHLRGVLLRVGQNMLKGAALIALSEGRLQIEMEDLLIAMKSGEWWVKGSVDLAEAVSASAYRRLVDGLVDLVGSRRKTTTATILKSPLFQNMKRFEVEEIIERAEKEGRINAVQGVWEVSE